LRYPPWPLVGPHGSSSTATACSAAAGSSLLVFETTKESLGRSACRCAPETWVTPASWRTRWVSRPKAGTVMPQASAAGGTAVPVCHAATSRSLNAASSGRGSSHSRSSRATGLLAGGRRQARFVRLLDQVFPGPDAGAQAYGRRHPIERQETVKADARRRCAHGSHSVPLTLTNGTINSSTDGPPCTTTRSPGAKNADP
jgi:hypothetical protein